MRVDANRLDPRNALRRRDPRNRLKLALHTTRELIAPCRGSLLALALQHATHRPHRCNVAIQHSRDRSHEARSVARLHTPLGGQSALSSTDSPSGVIDREQAPQRCDRSPHLDATEIRSKPTNPLDRNSHSRLDRQLRRPLTLIESNIDDRLLAAGSPIPARQLHLEQAPFKPRRLVPRLAHDRLDTIDHLNHRAKMAAVTKIRPVRRDAVAKVRRAAHVQDPAVSVTEPVDARVRRKQPRHPGRLR